MRITIRDAEPDDLDPLLRLMRQLAEHEGLGSYFQLTWEVLARCCLGRSKRFNVVVAAADATVVGYATYMYQFSPWAGREYLFVDDVYVNEDSRGTGIGSQLMKRIAVLALERDVDVRWHVETINSPAQRFYGALGAALRDKFIAYWSQDAMRATLAKSK